MGYCTTRQVSDIIAQALTSGTNDTSGEDMMPLIEFGSHFNRNTISDDIINQYMTWADEEIDGALSEMYQVPLLQKSDLELELLLDIDEYNNIVSLGKAYSLLPGDVLVFFNDTDEEKHIVSSVSNTNVELEDNIVGLFYVGDTRVLRVKYPPPISVISSRLTAANIYDKYFSAQVSPNISDYGKTLRETARRDLNNILNGRTILHGQRRIGHRFFNSNIRDRYRLPGADSDGSRDIGDVRG